MQIEQANGNEKRDIRSNLEKVDRHVVQPHEYEDIAELTDDFFERADHHCGGKLIQRWRSENQLSALPKR